MYLQCYTEQIVLMMIIAATEKFENEINSCLEKVSREFILSSNVVQVCTQRLLVRWTLH